MPERRRKKDDRWLDLSSVDHTCAARLPVAPRLRDRPHRAPRSRPRLTGRDDGGRERLGGASPRRSPAFDRGRGRRPAARARRFVRIAPPPRKSLTAPPPLLPSSSSPERARHGVGDPRRDHRDGLRHLRHAHGHVHVLRRDPRVGSRGGRARRLPRGVAPDLGVGGARRALPRRRLRRRRARPVPRLERRLGRRARVARAPALRRPEGGPRRLPRRARGRRAVGSLCRPRCGASRRVERRAPPRLRAPRRRPGPERHPRALARRGGRRRRRAILRPEGRRRARGLGARERSRGARPGRCVHRPRVARRRRRVERGRGRGRGPRRRPHYPQTRDARGGDALARDGAERRARAGSRRGERAVAGRRSIVFRRTARAGDGAGVGAGHRRVRRRDGDHRRRRRRGGGRVPRGGVPRGKGGARGGVLR